MNAVFSELLGQFIKLTPGFPQKPRLTQIWMRNRDVNVQRIRVLPGGRSVLCDLSVPYEAMVWLEQEEQNDLEVVRELLKPGQTFVDCGANIGIWTLVAASAVGETGRVYAFEPNPSTFEKLSRNVALGKSEENIRLFSAAVGSTNATLLFHCHEYHNISTVIERANETSISVSAIALDSVLGENDVHGIKIDVEGFEIEVLKGAQTILKQCQPWLCIEFNTLLAKVNTLSDWDVHQYLCNLGYVCRLFSNALDTSTQSILPNNWQTRGYCNLYYSVK